MFNPFPIVIKRKVSVITRVGFELAYFTAAVPRFSYYATETQYYYWGYYIKKD